MKIAQNTTSPSFTAKLKNNEATTNFISKMDASELKLFKKDLALLDKTHPNAVIELREKTENGKKSSEPTYEFVNTKNPSKKTSLEINKVSEFLFVLSGIARPGFKEHEEIFEDKETEKLRNDVFDMMA